MEQEKNSDQVSQKCLWSFVFTLKHHPANKNYTNLLKFTHYQKSGGELPGASAKFQSMESENLWTKIQENVQAHLLRSLTKTNRINAHKMGQRYLPTEHYHHTV